MEKWQEKIDRLKAEAYQNKLQTPPAKLIKPEYVGMDGIEIELREVSKTLGIETMLSEINEQVWDELGTIKLGCNDTGDLLVKLKYSYKEYRPQKERIKKKVFGKYTAYVNVDTDALAPESLGYSYEKKGWHIEDVGERITGIYSVDMEDYLGASIVHGDYAEYRVNAIRNMAFDSEDPGLNYTGKFRGVGSLRLNLNKFHYEYRNEQKVMNDVGKEIDKTREFLEENFAFVCLRMQRLKILPKQRMEASERQHQEVNKMIGTEKYF